MTTQNGFDRKPDYDLIVIGSGPAGCAAALNAVKYGLSVLIITAEKENNADDSFPSESLHPGIIGLISHINAESAFRKAFTGNYDGIMTYDNIHYFTDEQQVKQSGCHINKSVFTNELLQLAVERNVSLSYGKNVINLITAAGAVIGVKTDAGKEFIGKIIIDASGSRRIAAKLLGFETQFHSPPLLAWTGKVNRAVIPNQTISHFIPKANGWTWLAPEDNGCTFTCLALKGKHQTTVPPVLKGESGKTLKFNMRWRSHKTVAAEGILICGDAGAVFDPAAGQGILNALHSGIKASEAALQCIKNPEQEYEYLNQYNNWFSKETERKISQLKAYYKLLDMGFADDVYSGSNYS